MVMNIRKLRRAADITQTELAVAMGVTQSGVANWENENSLPSARQLPRLARVLGVPIGELFAEEEDEEETEEGG